VRLYNTVPTVWPILGDYQAEEDSDPDQEAKGSLKHIVKVVDESFITLIDASLQQSRHEQ
jgi:hypothetical protein